MPRVLLYLPAGLRRRDYRRRVWRGRLTDEGHEVVGDTDSPAYAAAAVQPEVGIADMVTGRNVDLVGLVPWAMPLPEPKRARPAAAVAAAVVAAAGWWRTLWRDRWPVVAAAGAAGVAAVASVLWLPDVPGPQPAPVPPPVAREPGAPGEPAPPPSGGAVGEAAGGGPPSSAVDEAEVAAPPPTSPVPVLPAPEPTQAPTQVPSRTPAPSPSSPTPSPTPACIIHVDLAVLDVRLCVG